MTLLVNAQLHETSTITPFRNATIHVNLSPENVQLFSSVLSKENTPRQKVEAATVELLDSVVTKDTSGKNTQKVSYNYDSNGNDTTELTYNWDDSTSKWLLTAKVKTLVDNNGMITFYESYTWFAGTFLIGGTKYESTYNNTKELTNTVYQWDFITSSWTLLSKSENAYDANQNLETTIDYSRNPIANAWVNESKSVFSYSAGNKLSLETIYQWNTNIPDWVTSGKSEHFMNSLGNDTSVIESKWDNTTSGWAIDNKIVYTYDGNQRITGLVFWEWDTDSGLLVRTAKQEFAFNSSGNAILYAIYLWDSVASSWTGFQKFEISYYPNSNLEHFNTTYSWSNNSWVENTQDESFYNNNNNKTLENNYMRNTGNSTWEKKQISTYYYSQRIIGNNPSVDEQTQAIFPNPVTHELHLIGVLNNSIITIVNVEGKTVYTKQYMAKTIDISSFVNGIYFLQIINNTGKTNYKFIKMSSK